MQIVISDLTPPKDATRKFGHSAFIPILTILGVGGVLVILLFDPDRQISLYLWAVPLAILGFGMLAWFLGRRAVACFRPYNWVMALSAEGLYLKYRPYLNCKTDADEPAVVYFPFGEIACARKTTVPAGKKPQGSGTASMKRWFLDLELNHQNTQKLAELVWGEQGQATHGVKVIFPNHEPVDVPRPGLIRVEWLGNKALRALDGRVAIGEPKVETPPS